jgi:hypothetical protein
MRERHGRDNYIAIWRLSWAREASGSNPDAPTITHWLCGRLHRAVSTFLFFSCYVFDRQQDHLRPALRSDAPRVQDHVPKSEMLEFVTHFKTVDARVASGDMEEESPADVGRECHSPEWHQANRQSGDWRSWISM